MAAQGLPCSIAGVAQAYEDFLDILICDTRDARAAEALRRNGLRVQCTQTIMRSRRRQGRPGARSALVRFFDSTLGERTQDHASAFRGWTRSRDRQSGDRQPVILVPVKNTSSAKQRLAAVLDQPSRTELAQAMLHDVLSALHHWPAERNSPAGRGRHQRSLRSEAGR